MDSFSASAPFDLSADVTMNAVAIPEASSARKENQIGIWRLATLNSSLRFLDSF